MLSVTNAGARPHTFIIGINCFSSTLSVTDSGMNKHYTITFVCCSFFHTEKLIWSKVLKIYGSYKSHILVSFTGSGILVFHTN